LPVLRLRFLRASDILMPLFYYAISFRAAAYDADAVPCLALEFRFTPPASRAVADISPTFFASLSAPVYACKHHPASAFAARACCSAWQINANAECDAHDARALLTRFLFRRFSIENPPTT